MPARLALDCMSAGEPITIAVLGMGVIENGGPDDDLRIADAYRDLAVDTDPADTVRTYYLEQAEEHPWMAEPLKVLTDLVDSPDDDVQDKIRHVAKVLSDQSIRGCEEWAETDLIGRVMLDMMHLAHRRKHVTGYMVTPYGSAIGALMTDPEQVELMGSMTDLWAGSGMRCIGVALAMRMIGRDPEKIRWRLMDADPLMRAACAINVRAFDLGEQIEILDGKPYKEAILAAYADGGAAALAGFIDLDALEAVPPDVANAIRDNL
jgi:hypothetical protein